MSVLAGALLGITLGVLAAPDAEASACAVRGPRVLGEACVEDSDCQSAECKLARCAKRTRPILKKGKSCWFNGDCCSDRCTWYKKCE